MNLLARFHRWLLPAILILFVLLGTWLFFSPDSGAIRVLDLKRERDRLQQEVQRLEVEKAELESQIQRLEAVDPLVIEEEARRKGMIREGDEVFRLQYREVPDSSNQDQSLKKARENR